MSTRLNEIRHDEENIVIVGAGPVGLSTALDLARRGIKTTIIERNQGPQNTGSRAIVLDRHALEFCERNGAGKILDQAIAPSGRDTYFCDTKLYGVNFPKPTPGELPMAGILPQFETEQALVEEVNQNPDAIRILWGHEVSGLEQTQQGVNLSVKSHANAGGINISSPYVIACDGARSNIRNMMQLAFPGFTDTSDFLIADVKVDLGDEKLAKFTFAPTNGKSQTQLVVPEPNGVWRMDWQLFPGEDPKGKMSPESVAEMVRATIGINMPFDVLWASCYRFHQRVIERFNKDRVFFAGDSAHLVSPFGGRGMNSGIRDGMNLSWKLAEVLSGRAPTNLLDSYHDERSVAAQENQDVTIGSMRFISPTDEVARATRDDILRRSVDDPSVRSSINSGIPSRPESNASSSLNYGTHPLIGQRAEDFALDGNGLRLRQITCDGFTSIDFTSNSVLVDGQELSIENQALARNLFKIDDGKSIVIRPDGYIGAVCLTSEVGAATNKMRGN